MIRPAFAARRSVIRNLHDTITRLGALRSQFAEPGGSEGRLSLLDDFGPNPGGLRARFYCPEELPEDAPLVVVLHGCGQNPEGYDRGAGWSKAADKHGFALLFPEQQRSNNPNLCFNWFSPADAERDSGEAQSIRAMIGAMEARFGTDPKRVFVTGLSAGGAMAAVMLATYPDVFAGGGIIAGLPFGSAQSVPEAFDRMRGHGGPNAATLTELVRSASNHQGPWPTLSIWHGSRDPIVDPVNAQDLVDQWTALHGAAKAPSRTDKVEGYPHRVWCDPEGRDVIEEYSITGMAHGTPLDPSDPAHGETAGAHMLDVGISSTRHLLHFWRLSPEVVKSERNVAVIAPPRERMRPNPESEQDTSVFIRRTIEDALRSAGLLH